MNTLKIFSLLATIGLLASCASNQDLVGLDEYDDLYYSGTDRTTTATASSTEFADEDASDAESAYYGESGYNEGPADASPIEEESEVADEDYYDPDYARRIENFHRNDRDPYIYDQAYGSPSFRWNVGLGYGSYSPYSMWNFGFSYGNLASPLRYSYSPFYYRYRPYCSPFYDPWCRYRPYYGFYDPWYPTPGLYVSPYAYFGYPVGGYPYYPYYSGGGGEGYYSNTEYGRRETSSRGSRGGVVRTENRSRSIDDGPKTNEQRQRGATESRERPTRTREEIPQRSDYYNRGERDRIIGEDDTRNTRTREGTNTRGNIRTPRRTESLTSPYTRQQQRSNTYDRSDSPTRYNTAPRRDRTRSTPQRNYDQPTRQRNYSPPSNNRMQRSSPSVSPSRSSSPNRSSSPSRSRDSRRR